jgi:CRP/FNR family transcriptional regulator, cyclic AMP receptor protein
VILQEFLRSVSLFRDLDDEELAHVLMIGHLKHYAQEAAILTEGAPGGQLHIIHQGRVRISKVVPGVGEEALTILGPGEFFGEVEFFDGAPASAHAIAHADCEVFTIPHDEVRALMQNAPALAARFLWAFSQTLAARLRESNQKISSLFAIAREF